MLLVFFQSIAEDLQPTKTQLIPESNFCIF